MAPSSPNKFAPFTTQPTLPQVVQNRFFRLKGQIEAHFRGKEWSNLREDEQLLAPAEIHGLSSWEAAWSPYDEDIYGFVLDHVGPEDVVLDIGAGDLRLARRLATVARRVTAIEINPAVVALASADWPANLSIVCADARHVPFPHDTTVGVLLMRHCQHFRLYVEKLRAVGCRRLITNARWGMGVEVVDLGPAPRFEAARAGWFACKCGAVGIVPGTQPDDFTAPEDLLAQEVETCPNCGPAGDGFA